MYIPIIFKLYYSHQYKLSYLIYNNIKNNIQKIQVFYKKFKNNK